MLQQELGDCLDKFEGLVRKLERFVKVLNTNKEIHQTYSGILLE